MTNNERLKQAINLLDEFDPDDGNKIAIEFIRDHAGWLVDRAQELEQVKTAYDDRLFDIDSLTEQVERYKQVLEFYADERIYVMQGFERARITADHGHKAREALEGDS